MGLEARVLGGDGSYRRFMSRREPAWMLGPDFFPGLERAAWSLV